MVGAVRVEGARLFPVAMFGAAIDPYVGRELSQSDLRALASAVAGVARDRGYIFAWAEIPAQTLEMGIVRVVLHEGTIDRIVVEGSESQIARAILASLVTGTGVRRDEVERALMLVGDLPGITLGKTRFEQRDGAGTLVVAVEESRTAVRGRLENDGPDAIGPDRVTLGYDFTGLAFAGDNLTVEGVTVPSAPRELGYVAMRYTLRPDRSGTSISASAAVGYTNPDGPLRQLKTHGRSIEAGLSASYPLIRGRRTSLWLGVDGGLQRIEQWQAGTRIRRDTLVTMRADLNGYAPLLRGRLRAGAGVADGLGPSGLGDPLASRPDGDARFIKGFAWINWFGKIAGPISAKLAGFAQIADRPLLAAEEAAIGGPRFGRGYDYAERTGDKGVLASAELQANIDPLLPAWVDWAHVYGFADAGKVINLSEGGGGGELYSTGGGVRIGFARNFDLGLEAAMPINEPRFESGDRSPRFRLTLGFNFD